MKQQVSESERLFVVDGFKSNVRADGRANLDFRRSKVELGTVQEGFGSSKVTFGEEDTQILCVIKAEVQKPLPSEPTKGQLFFHLESSQTGSSLFTREDAADLTRTRMSQIMHTLYGNIIDRSELMIFKGEFVWNLNVDVLVLDELEMHQLDHIARAIRSAFQDLCLPQVIATLNANTNKIEMGLMEEVYADKDNTDQLQTIASTQNMPHVISVAVLRDEIDGDLIVLDCDSVEIQCVD